MPLDLTAKEFHLNEDPLLSSGKQQVSMFDEEGRLVCTIAPHTHPQIKQLLLMSPKIFEAASKLRDMYVLLLEDHGRKDLVAKLGSIQKFDALVAEILCMPDIARTPSARAGAPSTRSTDAQRAEGSEKSLPPAKIFK